MSLFISISAGFDCVIWLGNVTLFDTLNGKGFRWGSCDIERVYITSWWHGCSFFHLGYLCGFHFLCLKLCIATTGWQHPNTRLLVCPWESVEICVMSVKVRWVTSPTHAVRPSPTMHCWAAAQRCPITNLFSPTESGRQTTRPEIQTEWSEFWLFNPQHPPPAHLNISMCTLCGDQAELCPKSVQKYHQNTDQSSSNTPVYLLNV